MNETSFIIKHFDSADDFVQVINPDIVENEISFSAQKNGGQGELRLVLNLLFSNNNFNHGDYIRVYVSNQYHPSGYLLYTGYIHNISLEYDGHETVELSMYGIASLLNDILHKSGGSLSFTETADPATILNNVITTHNVDYPGIITAGTIETYGTTVSYEVGRQTCFDVVNAVVELAEDYYWYVDQNGLLNFRQAGPIEHRFNYGKEIDSLVQNLEGQIVNKIYLDYNGGSKTYTDAASIAQYGIKEIAISDTSLQNVTTADAYAAKYFAEHAQPSDEISFVVNSLYYQEPEGKTYWDDADTWDDSEYWIEGPLGSFETVQPGQIIKIQNIDISIQGQVERITYYRDKMQISLNKFDNFTKLITQ